MNIATAWLATLFITVIAWGSTFGMMWSIGKKSRIVRIGMWGTITILVLGFFGLIGLIWFSVGTGIYVGGNP